MDLTVPMIHINGSSRSRLIGDLCDAGYAISEAIKALVKATPHMRDYCLFENPKERFDCAMREHRDRLQRLQSVLDELETLATLIDEAPGPRT